MSDLCTLSNLISKKGELIAGTGSSQYLSLKNILELTRFRDVIN